MATPADVVFSPILDGSACQQLQGAAATGLPDSPPSLSVCAGASMASASRGEAEVPATMGNVGTSNSRVRC